MTSSLRYVGKTHPNYDAVEKLTGRLKYAADMRLPGMLFAKLLLSPIAHGTVRSIDVSRAKALPGVIEVFSHENSTDRLFCRSRRLSGQGRCIEDERLFAQRVRFVGDRVAAVVATSGPVARAAASLVDVKYERLPAVLTPTDALREGAVSIGSGGNLIAEHCLDLGEDVEAVDGDVTTQTTSVTQRVHHAALDPHTCLADYDASGNLTVWSTSQSAFGVRTAVADLLDLSYSRVRVIKIPVGGSFGGRAEFYLEPMVAFIAKALRRPVKLLLDREQCQMATYTRPSTTTAVQTLVASDGVMRVLDADTTVDAGGYAGSGAAYAEDMTDKIPRLYRIGRIRHRSRAVHTNTPVTGGMRGWGAPEICVAMEIHLDQVAIRLQMDPVELRLRNLVHPFDVDPVIDVSLGDARVRDCLERGAELFDWTVRRTKAPDQGRMRRGVGVACGAHLNGLFGTSLVQSSTMSISMNEDGSLALSASLHEVGGGCVTLMRLIVGEVLGIDPLRIAVGEADTGRTPYDQGVFASRITYAIGALAMQTAEELKRRLLEAAASLYELPRDSLSMEDGCVRVSGDSERSISLGDIAVGARARLGQDIIATTTRKASSNPGSYCAQFAEVEVDCLTGLTKVTDFVSANDIGLAINRGMVAGQIQGAVNMGIGYALCEEMPFDEQGRIPGGGFKNYHLVNAPDMPDVRVLLVEHAGDEGPFGAKSVGEISMVPTAPAVINAVNHALGTAISDLPATPERILAALEGPHGQIEEGERCGSCCP
jgi:CO/xanthine dehydrogenase Mo-binding subunit